MSRPAAPVVVAALVLLGMSGQAHAQRRTRQERPQQGLFRTGGQSTMGLTFASYGGLDEVTVRVTENDLNSRRVTDGQYVGSMLGLNLARPLGRGRMQASGSTDLRYYPAHGDLQSLTAHTSFGSLNFGRPLRRHGALRLSQSFAAASFYQFNPFAGMGVRNVDELGLPTGDFQIDRGRTFSYDLATGTDWRLSRFDLLSVDYTLRYVNFPGEGVNLLTNGGGFRLSHRATRTISLNAGYGYQRAGAGGLDPIHYHQIDSGVQYQAAFFDRRTTVSATAGAAIVTAKAPGANTVASTLDATVFAALRHQVTDGWSAGLEYRRAPQILELYANPLYTDSLFASLRGSAGRRVIFTGTAGYSRSRLAPGLGDRLNQTYFGTVRTTWAAARTVSTYVEYAYYGFDTAPNRIATAPISRVGRQALRAGMNWALPLVVPRGRR